jgi:ribosomal protein S1
MALKSSKKVAPAAAEEATVVRKCCKSDSPTIRVVADKEGHIRLSSLSFADGDLTVQPGEVVEARCDQSEVLARVRERPL